MKILIIAVVVIVLGIGAYFVLGGPAREPVPTPNDSAQGGAPIPVDTDGGIGSTPAVTVTYTNDGFIPATITVNVGDTVRFVNQSTKSMWVGINTQAMLTTTAPLARNTVPPAPPPSISAPELAAALPGSSPLIRQVPSATTTTLVQATRVQLW